MYFSREFKSIIASVVIHLLILASYFYAKEETPRIANKEKIVSIDFRTFTLPKQEAITPEAKVIEKPTPMEIPKPKPLEEPQLEPIKEPEPIKNSEPIIQGKPKNEPIMEQKIAEIPKMEPIKKTEVKHVSKPQVMESKVIDKPLETKPVIDTQKEQQTFVKTNFAIIRDKVFANLVYPNIAKRMGWEGIAYIELTIDTYGKLVTTKITQSSGKALLDESALQAVLELKNTILPKPNAIATVILPISFKLK